MILADLAASKVAAEGDPRVWGGERRLGAKGGMRGEEAEGREGRRASVWMVRKHQSSSVSLPAHEGRQRITQLNLFVLRIKLELVVTSQPLSL